MAAATPAAGRGRLGKSPIFMALYFLLFIGDRLRWGPVQLESLAGLAVGTTRTGKNPGQKGLVNRRK
jgi:hypothetical protein